MSAHDRVHVNAPACSGPDSEGMDAVRPGISVIVPVNAQGDLQNVHYILGDIGRYGGPHSIETIYAVKSPDAAGLV